MTNRTFRLMATHLFHFEILFDTFSIKDMLAL